MVKVAIEKEAAQAITNYLAKQPFQEVAGFMNILSKCEIIKDEEPPIEE